MNNFLRTKERVQNFRAISHKLNDLLAVLVIIKKKLVSEDERILKCPKLVQIFLIVENNSRISPNAAIDHVQPQHSRTYTLYLSIPYIYVITIQVNKHPQMK